MSLSSLRFISVAALLFPSIIRAGAARPLFHIASAQRWAHSFVSQSQLKRFLSCGEVAAARRQFFKPFGLRVTIQCAWSLLEGVKFEVSLFGNANKLLMTLMRSNLQRKICAEGAELEVRTPPPKHQVAREIRQSEREKRMAEPEITLEMLLESLKTDVWNRKNGGGHPATVEWIIKQMKRSKLPDGSTALFRDSLEHSWKSFVEQRVINKGFDRPMESRDLRILEADKAYWNETAKLLALYNKEFDELSRFFESKNSVIYKRFRTLVKDLFALCDALQSSRRSGDLQEKLHGSMKILFAQEKINRLDQAIKIVIENLDVRFQRMHDRIMTRLFDDAANASSIRGIHQRLNRQDASSKIAINNRHREREPLEDYRPIKQNLYEQLQSEADERFFFFMEEKKDLAAIIREKEQEIIDYFLFSIGQD